VENRVAWKPSVAVEFTGTVEKHLIPRFQGRDAATITASEVKQFRAALAALPGRQGRRLSPKRINNILVVLRLVLTMASGQAGTPNPFAALKRLRVPKADIRPFTLDELRTFLAGVRPDYTDYYIVRFFTGMRPGEVDGLQWADVDWDAKRLRVRRTRQRTGCNEPKTADSTRDLDLLPPVMEALRRQHAVFGERSPYVFCTARGTARDHNLITRRVWYPTLDRLRLARRSPYQTRHTFATLMLAAGENPEWIARQLGHVDTTLLFTVYSRFVRNLTRQDGSAALGVIEVHGVLPETPPASPGVATA
jgi:integrase